MFDRRLAGAVLLGAVGAGACACAAPPRPAATGTGRAAGSSFTPALLSRVAGASAVVVLGTRRCAAGLCPQLWRITPGEAGASDRLAVLDPPPGRRPDHPGATGSIGRLVFAGDADGYAVEGAAALATVDGGRHWHRVRLGAHRLAFAMAAAKGAFYAVLVRCVGAGSASGVERCGGYRLGRSVAGTTTWSSVPIPGTARLDGQGLGLGALGDRVWLSVPTPTTLGTRFLESRGGQAPFATTVEPRVAGVSACSVDPEAGGVIWSACPTGMMVTWWRLSRSGRRAEPVWTTAGTGGGLLDPLSASVAYRYPGVGSHAVQLSTDGGRRFRPVGRLPFTNGAEIDLVFLDREDGFALGSIAPHGNVEAERSTLLQTRDGGARWTAVRLWP